MHIATSIKQKACEGLLHFRSHYSIAKELGISKGSVRDWSILINHGNFDWIYQTYRPQNKTLLHEAINFWFDNYPIGYSDVARRFGIRPASLFGAILRYLDKLPDMLKPKRIRYWDPHATHSLGTYKMKIEKLSDIPTDRPLTESERKALFKELEEAKGRLICAESLLEVAVESCKDELKKKN